MPPGGLVARVGAQHAAQLLNQLPAIEPLHLRPATPAPARERPAGAALLHDAEVPRGERGHLRQVRDAQDLAAVRQRAQALPTARAVAPPTPASTSSNTTVGEPSTEVAMLIRASITRDSSPPEATSRSGPGHPGFGPIRNSTESPPPGRSGPAARRRRLGRSSITTSNVASAIARSPSSAHTAFAAPAALPRPARRRPPARPGRRRARSSSPPAAPWSRPHSRAGRARRGSVRRARAPPRSSRRAFASAARAARGAPRRPPGARGRPPARQVGAQLGRDVLQLVDERPPRAPRARRAPRRCRGAAQLLGRAGQQRHRPGSRPCRVDRLGAAEAACRSVSTAPSRPRSRSSSASSPAGRDRLDLRDLELEEVEVALARAEPPASLQLALDPARVRARRARTRSAPSGGARRRRRRGSRAGPRPPSACGARAARRTRPAASDRAQVLRGDRAALQVRARRPVGHHAAAEHQLRLVERDALGELGQLGSAASPAGGANTPSTYASSAPGRTMPRRGLPPSSRSSAWASMVLPAPVSPVIAFRPRSSASSALSISSRFRTRSSSSTRATCISRVGRATKSVAAASRGSGGRSLSPEAAPGRPRRARSVISLSSPPGSSPCLIPSITMSIGSSPSFTTRRTSSGAATSARELARAVRSGSPRTPHPQATIGPPTERLYAVDPPAWPRSGRRTARATHSPASEYERCVTFMCGRRWNEHLVDREPLGGVTVRQQGGHLHDLELAGERKLDRARKVLAVDSGEEPDAPVVDREHRHVGPGVAAQRAQGGAAPPRTTQMSAPPGPPRVPGRGERPRLVLRGLLRVEQQLDAGLAGGLDQRADAVRRLGPAGGAHTVARRMPVPEPSSCRLRDAAAPGREARRARSVHRQSSKQAGGRQPRGAALHAHAGVQGGPDHRHERLEPIGRRRAPRRPCRHVRAPRTRPTSASRSKVAAAHAATAGSSQPADERHVDRSGRGRTEAALGSGGGRSPARARSRADPRAGASRAPRRRRPRRSTRAAPPGAGQRTLRSRPGRAQASHLDVSSPARSTSRGVSVAARRHLVLDVRATSIPALAARVRWADRTRRHHRRGARSATNTRARPGARRAPLWSWPAPAGMCTKSPGQELRTTTLQGCSTATTTSDMTLARLVPLPMYAALEVALASIVIWALRLGFEASALVVAVVMGVLMMGTGLAAATQISGRGGPGALGSRHTPMSTWASRSRRRSPRWSSRSAATSQQPGSSWPLPQPRGCWR